MKRMLVVALLAILAGPAWAVEPKAVAPEFVDGVEGQALYISAFGSRVDPGRKIEWRPAEDSPELAEFIPMGNENLLNSTVLWSSAKVRPADKAKGVASVYRVKVVAKGKPEGADEIDADSTWVKITVRPVGNPTPGPGPSPVIPDLPAPTSKLQEMGRSYGKAQLQTYIETWEDTRTQLAAGVARKDLNATFASRWQLKRDPIFAPIAAEFAKIVPDTIEPVGEQKDNLNAAWGQFVTGLKESIR